MLLIRFYIIIVLCFFNQDIQISKEIFDKVELRDITIKYKRKTIYNWTGDWLEEVNLYLKLKKIKQESLINFNKKHTIIILFKNNKKRY